MSRQARDLDLGFVLPLSQSGKATEPPEDLLTELEHYMKDIVKTCEAEVEKRGHDLYVKKTYSPEQLIEKTIGKREYLHIAPEAMVTVQIKVPKAYLRSPLLPLVPYGDKGFIREDIKEVLGAKLSRMIGPKGNFQVRDVMDFYNLMQIGEINIARDAEELRTIAMVYIASNMAQNMHYQGSLASLQPTNENILNAAQQLNVHSDYFEELRDVYQQVSQAVEQIFPRSRTQLPARLADSANLTLNELNFVTRISGVEHLPNNSGTKSVTPAIIPSLIVPSEMVIKYPELVNNIRQKHELTASLERAQAERNMRDF